MNDDDRWGPSPGRGERRGPPAKPRPGPNTSISPDGWRSHTEPVSPKPRFTLSVGPRTRATAYACLGVATWLLAASAYLGRPPEQEIDTHPASQPIKAIVPAVDGPDGAVAETCRRYDLPVELCEQSERCAGAQGFQVGGGHVTLILRSSADSCARNLAQHPRTTINR